MAITPTETQIFSSDAAGQSDEFQVDREPVTAHLYGTLVAAEYVDLQRKGNNGTFYDVYDHSFAGSGGQVRLDSATATAIQIVAPGVYRFDVDDPTNTVTITITRPDQRR